MYGRRARSKSFNSFNETSEKKQNIAKTDEYDGSSLKLSSQGESACEGEINDSRFNDISCIDYADRTIDEKDTSRIDVEENNTCNKTSDTLNGDNNKSNSFKERLNTSSASNASSCGSKRKHNQAFENSASLDKSSLSTKRMRRDSQRAATDGMKVTNPSPLAIPIASEMKLPPDRLSGAAAGLLATAENNDSTASAASEALPSNKSRKKESSSNSLNELLELGHNCARLFNATCVSEQLSKSYGEDSLRFTCQNGHNFFLSVQNLKKTYALLAGQSLTSSELSEDLLNSLSWCNKCAKYYAKVKSLHNRTKMNVLGGLYQSHILLQCKAKSHCQKISYNKKLEQISCLRCRTEERD